MEGLIATAERLGLEPTHVLLTHHHFDHVSEVPALRERWPELEGADPPAGARAAAGRDRRVHDAGRRDAHVRRPGGAAAAHARAHRGDAVLLVGERSQVAGAGGAGPGRGHGRAATSAAPGGFTGGEAVVFTGDTLFKGSVGGVRAPGHTTYTDLRDSIMGTLMELPPNTVIHPGHADPTTVAREWEQNGFIRIWRGLDPEGQRAL